MSHLNGRIVISLILFLAALTGCAQQSPAPVSSAPYQAPVSSVEILQVVGAPGQVRAYVKGALPDACSRLADPAVDVSGSMVVVILPAVRDSSAKNCAAAPVPYERSIDLGSAFGPGTYAVQINGFDTQFSLNSDGKQVAAAVGGAPVGEPATAIPTKVSAAASMQQPTPTAQPQAAEQPTATPTQAAQQPAAPEQPTPTAVPASAGANPGAPASQPAEPTPTPTQAAAQVQPSGGQTAPSGCVNKAAFYGDVTVEDGTLFDPGQAFTKIWQVKNAGTCAWSGYLLVFKEGDALSAAQPLKLERAVAPGDLVKISVNMTAPQTPGSYYSDWLLSGPDGASFGTGAAGDGRLWVKIGVRAPVPVTGGPVCVYQTNADYEAQVLQMVNDARTAAGFKALVLDPLLSAAARGHSQDMACNDFVDHYGSDGSTWYARITAQGVKYRTASENIYAGDPTFGGTPQGAFTWWMNSKIHHDNILNPKATKIGIGYITAPSSTYKGYYTLNFVEP